MPYPHMDARTQAPRDVVLNSIVLGISGRSVAARMPLEDRRPERRGHYDAECQLIDGKEAKRPRARDRESEYRKSERERVGVRAVVTGCAMVPVVVIGRAGMLMMK